MSDVLGQDGQARSSITKHGGMRNDILDVYSMTKNSELSHPSYSTHSANFCVDGADDDEEDLEACLLAEMRDAGSEEDSSSDDMDSPPRTVGGKLHPYDANDVGDDLQRQSTSEYPNGSPEWSHFIHSAKMMSQYMAGLEAEMLSGSSTGSRERGARRGGGVTDGEQGQSAEYKSTNDDASPSPLESECHSWRLLMDPSSTGTWGARPGLLPPFFAPKSSSVKHEDAGATHSNVLEKTAHRPPHPQHPEPLDINGVPDAITNDFESSSSPITSDLEGAQNECSSSPLAPHLEVGVGSGYQAADKLESSTSATPVISTSHPQVAGDVPHLAPPERRSSSEKNSSSISEARSEKPCEDLPRVVHRFSEVSRTLLHSGDKRRALAPEVAKTPALKADETDAVTDATLLNDAVLASVQEEVIVRRIERDKARAVSIRRTAREAELRRALRSKIGLCIQAMYRGWRARKVQLPILSSWRREKHESFQMMEEERRSSTALRVALEMEREEAARRRQNEELIIMRSEESRMRRTWAKVFRDECMRQEELARMRAEERRALALGDLEREDHREAETHQRENKESGRIHEDQRAACREGLDHAISNSMKVAENLRDGDVASSARSGPKERRLPIEEYESSAASISRTSPEEREEDACQVCDRDRSTPIQRAADPAGITAARQFLLPAIPPKWPRATIEGTTSPMGSVIPMPVQPRASCSEELMLLERKRRREHCKVHLTNILRKTLDPSGHSSIGRASKEASGIEKRADTGKEPGWSRQSTAHRSGEVEHLDGANGAAGDGTTSHRDGYGGKGRVGLQSSRSATPLTMNMLSHLGALCDLVELDLCVEGISSAPLLRGCTTLKSLSLNVNRFSSPEDLVTSTSLVRLSLRDNRLSSLKGLSHLPNLRELHLDINHLTSLHDLQGLPGLVELSANSNYIRELPQDFSARIMSRSATQDYQDLAPAALALAGVSRGGLQRLELYHNRISAVHLRSLEGLSSLTHLDLGRNQLETLDGRSLESCPALSTLVLSQNQMRAPPAPLRLPLLEELWLSGNRLGSMGEWSIAPHLPSLNPCRVHQLHLDAGASPAGEGFPGAKKYSISAAPPYREDRQGTNGTARSSLKRDADDCQRAIEQDYQGRENLVVWLPSLQVLHLEDNMLESLGSIWSLAGVPILKYLDLSFNRFSAPNGFVPCIRACCTWLQEVRLHDNPVATQPSYAEIVTLCSPRLTRIDGFPLNQDAHWRAAFDSARKGELVLPLLFNSTGSFDLGGIRFKPPPHGALDGKSEMTQTLRKVNKPCVGRSDARGDTPCAWCGGAISGSGYSGTPRAQGENLTSRDTPGRGPTGGSPTHSTHCDKSPSTVVGDGIGLLPQRRCTSCSSGFLYRDLSLRPESLPSRAHLPIKWRNVRSAGWQWRLMMRQHEYPGITEESVTATAFQRSCLEIRTDRERMRQRHRAQERNLHLRMMEGEEAKTTKDKLRATAEGTGSHRKCRQCTPSVLAKRRLEAGFELKEAHARERAEVAAEHLLFHISPGDKSRHRSSRRHTAAYVLATPRTLSMSVDSGAKAVGGPNDAVRDKEAVEERLTRERNEAATRAQRVWRRRRQAQMTDLALTGLINGPGPGTDTENAMHESAAVRLQSSFRGFHTRRALQAALEVSKYVDEELDTLIQDGEHSLEFDRLPATPPELAEEWWSPMSLPLLSGTRQRLVPPVSCESKILKSAVGYGGVDGRRRDRGGNGGGEGKEESLRVEPAQTKFDSEPSDGGGTGPNEQSESGVGREDTDGIHEIDETSGRRRRKPLPRLIKKDSDGGHGVVIEGATDASGGIEDSRNDLGRDEVIAGTDDNEMNNDLARSWGLKDPMVARNMMRRARRMRRFERKESQRQKLKDPLVRFSAFVKSAGDHRKTHSKVQRL